MIEIKISSLFYYITYSFILGAGTVWQYQGSKDGDKTVSFFICFLLFGVFRSMYDDYHTGRIKKKDDTK